MVAIDPLPDTSNITQGHSSALLLPLFMSFVKLVQHFFLVVTEELGRVEKHAGSALNCPRFAGFKRFSLDLGLPLTDLCTAAVPQVNPLRCLAASDSGLLPERT